MASPWSQATSGSESHGTVACGAYRLGVSVAGHACMAVSHCNGSNTRIDNQFGGLDPQQPQFQSFEQGQPRSQNGSFTAIVHPRGKLPGKHTCAGGESGVPSGYGWARSAGNEQYGLAPPERQNPEQNRRAASLRTCRVAERPLRTTLWRPSTTAGRTGHCIVSDWWCRGV
jgi:hypothetical protein